MFLHPGMGWPYKVLSFDDAERHGSTEDLLVPPGAYWQSLL